jgi:hypothetical protein
MIKKEGLKGFLYGVLSYFVVSIILELIGINNWMNRFIILLAIFLTVISLLTYFQKKKV